MRNDTGASRGWQPKTDRCAFLVDNLDLEAATGFEGARWEPFQLRHLDDDSVFRIEVKSRQIAWSWLNAAEAVADGILNGVGTVFVSINLDEAMEKIRYAKNVIDALPPAMQPPLVTDNKTELEFANRARLISLPSTAPRGKAQMNVTLDEFAHVRDDGVIYTAALPMITKGNRRLRVGSSPLGASGRFWEVYTESLRKYPGYTRHATPWWEVQAFCRDVRTAYVMATGMVTSERVALFGNERIQAIYANMPEEDFQQEYETIFADQSTAWITWEEITDSQSALVCHTATSRERDISAAIAAIDALREDIRRGAVEQVFAGGVDVGRSRNTSELFLVGRSTLDSYPLRLMVTLDNMPFDEQRNVLAYALNTLPIARLLIDRNGLGMNLAENLETAYPGKVEGVNFTQPSKVLWATDVKMLLTQRRAPLPVDKDLAYQIHSIKRLVSAAKNLIFDTARNEKHHADKFWALALALCAARYETGASVEELAGAFGWRG